MTASLCRSILAAQITRNGFTASAKTKRGGTVELGIKDVRTVPHCLITTTALLDLESVRAAARQLAVEAGAR